MTMWNTFRKPTEYPDYAMGDVNNGPMGEPNVDEPEPARKNDGWYYGEEPPRQYFNWLHRLTSRWVRHLDKRTSRRKSKLFRNM